MKLNNTPKEAKSIAHNATINCQTPTAGKSGTRIPIWKYTILHDAILDVLDMHTEIDFKDLHQAVAKRLKAEDLSRLGSLKWHVTTVKLNMEYEGGIMRIKGMKPQRLKRISV